MIVTIFCVINVIFLIIFFVYFQLVLKKQRVNFSEFQNNFNMFQLNLKEHFDSNKIEHSKTRDVFYSTWFEKTQKSLQDVTLTVCQTVQEARLQIQTGLDASKLDSFQKTSEHFQKTSEQLQYFSDYVRRLVLDSRSQQDDALLKMITIINQTLKDISGENQSTFKLLKEELHQNLNSIRQDNEEKLEKIRLTVEKKLQETLESRLSSSFQSVSLQLEQVYKGLGEMQKLAKGVGDLKAVLSNVKLRGNFGEIQLMNLVEEVLAPEQYEKNFAICSQSSERVDVAIKMPGRDSDSVYLPIDAKFPQEDYLRLQKADEAGDDALCSQIRKSLRARIIDEATKISKKYIIPPKTTDFAILFLPTESLYAEVLRLPQIWDELQRLHVIVSGPTNFLALLNSLHMGFRTLAIQKRSHEVWGILGAVKAEFEKFGESLDAVSKKIQEASFKMDETTKRTRAITRKLKSVEVIGTSDLDNRTWLADTEAL